MFSQVKILKPLKNAQWFGYIVAMVWSTTHSTQILQKQEDGCNTYAIMKTMCHPSYYHNDFVAIHALGHMMYGCV